MKECELHTLVRMLINEVEASGEAEGIWFGECRNNKGKALRLERLIKEYKERG